MQATPVLDAPHTNGGIELSRYCDEIFAPLARSEQRRWGEVYVRGLLEIQGRKTLARISEHVLGRRTVHPLHQFLSKSTWDATLVRRQLAHQIVDRLQPRAWAVDEVVFPKYGDRTVGVARQYAHTLGRSANCQIGLATSLLSEGGAVPVNWRLTLPPRWDRDEELRRCARVPEQEGHRPRWQYVLDAADEMAEEWDLPPVPLLADWRSESEVEPLLLALEGRGLGYVVRLGPGAEVARPHFRPRAMAAPAGRPGQPVTARELVARAERHSGRSAQSWYDHGSGQLRRSQFLTALVPGHAQDPRTGAAYGLAGVRHLVAEWPMGRPEPTAYWVTNLGVRQLPDVVAVAKLHHKSAYSLKKLEESHGLGDFEGRSFVGWHHHVTLVGAAHVFRTLNGVPA